MITEGRGRHAPAPYRYRLNRSEAILLKNDAAARAVARRYARKGDEWSVGLLEAVDDPLVGHIDRDVRPIYASFVGVYAVKQYLESHLKIPVDADFGVGRAGSPGFDLQPAGMTLLVRTRQSVAASNLIRRYTSSGRKVPLMAEACAFCRWIEGADVDILGWTWTRELEGRPEVPSRRGGHRNIAVRDDELLPMVRLIAELDRRRKEGY